MTTDALRAEILALTRRFAEATLAPRPFVAGQSPVPVSGKVIAAEEICHLVDASLDGWLTTGRFNEAFESALAEFLGAKHVLTVNSGSSANLLAVAALTCEDVGERALRPGDEVITVAAGFPTTVNPLLLYGLVPVFVDIQLPTYNIDTKLVEAAITAKTRAIMLAHTLGNPFDVAAIRAIADRHDLWLIEDCCDALGSTYQGRPVGSFGDIATLSFYPAHQITTGEGGAVFTQNGKLKRVLESLRDWGRDCFCAPGADNTCGKRFCWQLGELPEGYDHKYIYSHLGFNLKMTDMQAAVGLAQTRRLPDFIKVRRQNFAYLRERLAALEDRLILPEATPFSEPSWFGFPLSLRDEVAIDRRRLIDALESRKIATRLLFGGNLTRQPYFRDRQYRVAGSLEQTDRVMNRSFWLGVFPGLSAPQLDHIVASLTAILDQG